MKHFLKQASLAFIFLFVLNSPLLAAESNIDRSEHVEAQLVTELVSVQPGTRFTIALRMKMDEHWHTYWRNGADSGLPTEITWTLPEGYTASEISWPYPEKIDTPPLITYGYHDQVFLLTEITVPENVQASEQIKIAAKADWLECDDVCIPGGVELEINLKVADGTPQIDEKWIKDFADARARLPITSSGWRFAASENNGELILQGQAPDWFDSDLGDVYFFAYEYGLIEYEKPQMAEFKDEVLTIKLVRPEGAEKMAVEGILVSQEGWRGLGSEKAHYINVETQSTPLTSKTESGGVGSIFYYLLLAFGGGIILNLMPCVLPVLSLKIMGFVQQANDDQSQAWKHGAVFTLGVLVSFWVLAGSLLALRAGGEQLGWGFQLQEPVFLIILSAFLFLFAISMFGVFEIGTSLTTIEGKTGNKSGWAGSFISGVTATVVATPCTAPFMGSALGFALTQPYWVSMAVFTFLGLGMAFPYVLLSSIPALLKFVPKPGRWMESMKEFMGFLLLATVLWLLWVLGIQAGTNMVIVVLGALLVLGIAGWIYGRWGNLAMPKKSRNISTAVALIITILTLFFTIDNVDAFAQTPRGESSTSSSSQEGIPWQNYSEELVKELRSKGQAVFIDFTAAWCLSCQVNDRVTFSSEEVQNKFSEMGINAIKADWTSRDDRITKALASFGRNSVPLYVYFPPGKDQDYILLPELITPGIILDAFENGANAKLSSN
jgi:thiol:disulfide interchange protein